DTSSGFFGRWLKKQGQEPVLLSEVNRDYNENLLRNKMENLGFFNAEVTSDTLINGKKASAHYDAFPGQIYRINQVKFDIDSTTKLGKSILATQKESLLQTGNNYNLDVILNERDRIDDQLKHQG